MLFNSLSFLVFFPLCISVFFIVPKKARAYWLLLCSLFFYMCWNAAYVLLLISSILITYGAGRLIEKYNDSGKRKNLIVFISVFLNLSILFVFKYLNFFLDTFSKLTKSESISVSLLLPVGISFYTFQAIGYTIDVYRGEKAERNIVKYALFVSFFPQLVAGPIERSGNLLKRINELESIDVINREDIVKGSYTMLYGYFMKMMIADRAAILVDTVYNCETYGQYRGLEVLVAAVLFSIQIYCDFAGYTYIAIGAARVMGFKLCDNFNTPYLSVSIKDFWDRWHMSLSTWFRDYLYFPLGGSRKGKLRKYINIFIVFAVSGLWHGASWHFVAWGVLHGVLRITGELTEKFREKLAIKTGYNREALLHTILRIILNFFTVTIAWMFFRAESTNQAIELIKNMFTGFELKQFAGETILNLGLDGKEMTVLLLFILLMIIIDVRKRRNKDTLSTLMGCNDWVQFAIFFFGIIAVVIFGIYGASYNAASFIYFQF